MEYAIARHVLPEQHIVSLRDRRSKGGLPAFLGRAFGDLFGSLPDLGATPAGPPFVIYHAFGDEEIDAEVCVPVAHPVSATETLDARVLPAMTVASTLHVGRYEDLQDAYDALMSWVRDHGYEVAGPVHERYLNGPGDELPPSEYRTIIEVPIAPAPIPAHV